MRLKQSIISRSETRQGLISGALFGTLIGALFLNPLAGLAAGSVIGGATGALTGSLLDFEISDDFVREVGRSLRPNSSALFLLVRRMKPEEVLKELQGSGGHVMRSTLSPAQEARLEEALSRHQDAERRKQLAGVPTPIARSADAGNSSICDSVRDEPCRLINMPKPSADHQRDKPGTSRLSGSVPGNATGNPHGG